jgi:predicted nucleic acid-binding protein
VRNIVVDAGPMFAMFDRDDAHHSQAGEFLRKPARSV